MCVCVCVYVVRNLRVGVGVGGGVDRGCGGVAGSVTDNHLATVARAARVGPLLQWHVMGGRCPPSKFKI